MKSLNLVGRGREFDVLNQLLSRNQSSFVIIYGRRRVGKTTLIQRWSASTKLPVFYWESPRSTADNVRSSLVREFSRWNTSISGATAPRYDDWLDVFRAMRQSIGDQQVILVFDEFPWAVEADASLPSHLKTAWDQLFADSRVHLFITGSHISAMEKLLDSDAPLFGRLTRKLHVRPLSYAQIKPFVARYDIEKRLAVFSIVGGIPDYLRTWDDRQDLLRNIEHIFVSDNSPYRTERQLLISDVLRRSSPDYEAVLDAVGRGQHDADSIATDTVLSSHRVSQVLSTLVEVRLIDRRVRASVPIRQQQQARHGRYFLNDPFLQFYYRFIAPNRTLIAQGLLIALEREFREQMRAFVGAAFEELCRTWTLDQAQKGKLPMVPEYIGSDWGPQHQADVVAVNWRSREVLIGEAKWTEHAINKGEWEEFKARIEHVLARLRAAESVASKTASTDRPDWKTHLYLFARRGVTAATQKASASMQVKIIPFATMARDLERSITSADSAEFAI